MSEEQEKMSEKYAKALRWWSHWRCPLVPQIEIEKADNHNTAGFNLHWLFFRAWTSDVPRLGASIELCDSGFFIRLDLPYLWTGLFFYIFPNSVMHKLWRKPKGRK